MPQCPRCSSFNVKVINQNGLFFRQCLACTYDEYEETELSAEEREENAFPEERGSQKEKGRFNPYKTGGKQRTR